MDNNPNDNREYTSEAVKATKLTADFTLSMGEFTKLGQQTICLFVVKTVLSIGLLINNDEIDVFGAY